MEWGCKYCEFSCSSPNKLIFHYRSSHFIHGKRTLMPCLHKDCVMTFSQISKLSVHMNNHHKTEHSKNIPMLKCTLCDHKVDGINMLISHLRRHLKQKASVACPFSNCSFASNIASTFSAHITRKHQPYDPGQLHADVCPIDSCSDGYVENVDPSVADVSSRETHSSANDSWILDSWSAETTLLSDQQLQNELAKLFVKMNAVLHVPKYAVQEIITGLNNIHLLSKGLLKQKLSNILLPYQLTSDNIDEVVNCVINEHPLYKHTAQMPTAVLSSVKLRDTFVKDSLAVVEPVEYVFGRSKRGKQATFVYVPIINVLKQLLSKPEICSKVFANRPPSVGKYSSYADGNLYKARASVSHHIDITLYNDDWETVNPLGTSRKKYKVNALYWTLTNLDPKYKSALHVIQLGCMAKCVDIEEFGWDKYLRPLLQDLVFLKEHGMFIESLGSSIKGSITAVVADNLGAHTLAGFTESFGPNVPYICRFCTATSADVQNPTLAAHEFPSRTREGHDQHVKELEENPSVFGVKKQCVIHKYIQSFHPVSGFPPDIAHDLLEGIVPVELAMCLKMLMQNKAYKLDVTGLSHTVATFEYKFKDKTNKPQRIPANFANSGTVGGNATENWTLIRLLPVILGNKIEKNDPAWELLLDLKDIVELCFAPTLSDSDIDYLACKIYEHKQLYKSLFPDKLFKPKHHFIEHYPRLMKEHGPLVHLWTMRFEAKHSYFKRVVHDSHCFKNILKTLANKHQLMSAYYLDSPNYFTPDVHIKDTKSIAFEQLSLTVQQAVRGIGHFDENLLVTPSASVNGADYECGMIVVTGTNGGLPEFSEILHIAVISGKVHLIVMLQSSWFDEHIRGFIIESADQVNITTPSDLIDYYPLVSYTYNGDCCVMLKHFVSTT